MNRTIPIASSIVISIVACGAAGAQVRGRVAPPPPPPARPVVVHVAPVSHPSTGSRAPIMPVHTVRRSPAPPVTPSIRFVTGTNGNRPNGAFSNSTDAPGLGFDYSDFFAMHPNIGILDRDHNRNGFGQGFAFFSPFGLYGSPMFYPSDNPPADQSQGQPDEPQPQQQQQPQIVIVMPPNGQQYSQQNAQADTRNSSSTQAAQTVAADSTPAPSEYVLLRRDGGLLFTSAFTVQSGQLTYISSEGSRHKVLLSELDIDATRKMNEQRGTNISLPNDTSTR